MLGWTRLTLPVSSVCCWPGASWVCWGGPCVPLQSVDPALRRVECAGMGGAYLVSHWQLVCRRQWVGCMSLGVYCIPSSSIDPLDVLFGMCGSVPEHMCFCMCTPVHVQYSPKREPYIQKWGVAPAKKNLYQRRYTCQPWPKDTKKINGHTRGATSASVRRHFSESIHSAGHQNGPRFLSKMLELLGKQKTKLCNFERL